MQEQPEFTSATRRQRCPDCGAAMDFYRSNFNINGELVRQYHCPLCGHYHTLYPDRQTCPACSGWVKVIHRLDPGNCEVVTRHCLDCGETWEPELVSNERGSR